MKKDVENKLILEKDRRLKLLPDFVEDFITSIENRTSIRTQIGYIKDIDMFLNYLKVIPELANKNLNDLSPTDFKYVKERDIRDFLKDISEFKKTYKKRNGTEVTQEYSNSQQGKARKVATLSTFWEYLIDNGYVEKNITRKIKVKVDKVEVITNMLEKKEIDLYLDTIMNDYNIESERKLKFHQRLKFRDYVMVLTMSYTGIRVSELIQLDIDDILISKGTMQVIRKGRKIQEKYIPKSVQEPIAEFIELRKTVEDVPLAYKNALFLSQQKKRIDAKTVRYMLKKYKDRCGIQIKITPHTLRRSYGMELLEKTGNIELVRNELGHECIETTRRSYAQVKDKTRKNIVQNFEYGSDSAPVEDINIEKIKNMAKKCGLSIQELIEQLLK